MKIASNHQCSAVGRLSSVLVLACMALMTGCGQNVGTSTGTGAAGVGTGGTGTVLYALAGRVADGYLVNATVFLDKNGNYQLDAGEPFAITDQNGAYKLDVAPADVGNYPIVALATKGVTIDQDTNLPVENSYVLSMPKESISGVADNFISPISSQLREMMESGAYTSLPQAVEALRAKMGLPTGTNLQADYVATQHRSIHAAAQNIAALMGNQSGQLLTTDGSSVAVDVKRYRRMMAAVNANMPTVMEQNRQNAVQSLSRTIATAVSQVSR